MELNDLHLSPVAIAELYGKTLVDLPGNSQTVTLREPEKTAANRPAETPALKSLGNNQQQILLLVKQPDAVFLTDLEMNFLTGVLTACKLSMADVALVNWHHFPDTGYKELITQFRSRIVFLFDIAPDSIGLPLRFPQYQLQAFAGNTFLYVPSLSDLEKDKVEKSKLWVCLKRLFNL